MRKLILVFITIAIFFLTPFTSEASHFRYGNITWTRTPGTRTVTFTIITAWRYDFTENVDINFGDGTSENGVLGTEIQYVPNDYRVFRVQLTHTYATDGPFTVSFNSCCRISTLQNGADDYFTVSSIVCLSNNNLGSPVCSSPVVIEMNAGGINQYQLITSEPDGTPITYSTVAIQSNSYVPTVGGNIATVSSTGLISWNTTGAVDGQVYQMKVSLSDGCAKTEIDFIIRITACSSTPASAIIAGNQTINLGQSVNLTLTFNGSPPWTYRLSGTTSNVTTSTTPTIISVTPTTTGTNTYTLTSVSNACGGGNVSGSAVITVNPNLQLLACYKFDGNALDSKGSNHGTVNGAILTTDRFGKANSAYNFNGNGNYIAIPSASLAPSQYTYSAWVNASELPAYGESRTILSMGNAGGDQFLMLLNSSATNGSGWNYGSYIGYATAALPPLLSYTSVVANNWVHFVVVRNSSVRKIYINGQLSVSNTATANPYYSTPILGAIGARFNGTQIQTFKGKIDDVKIYNGTLSDEEVLLLYNEEQGECSAPCSGMIYSLSSGDWNTPATWSCGRVPDLTDKVLIKSGHNVRVSTNNAKARKLLNNGQVLLANSTSKLTFGNGAVQTITYENQPNATIGKDAFVSSFLPNGLHETSVYMGPYAGTNGGVNDINRTFIAFDLSTIPTNAIIDSAYLTLFYSQAIVDILYQASTYFDGHVGDTRIWIQKVTQPWAENTITWNNQPLATTANQISVPTNTSKTQNYKLIVKDFVQGMVANPTNNYGFMLRLQNETPYTLVALATSDEANPSIRPKIQVYYHLP